MKIENAKIKFRSVFRTLFINFLIFILVSTLSYFLITNLPFWYIKISLLEFLFFILIIILIQQILDRTIGIYLRSFLFRREVRNKEKVDRFLEEIRTLNDRSELLSETQIFIQELYQVEFVHFEDLEKYHHSYRDASGEEFHFFKALKEADEVVYYRNLSTQKSRIPSSLAREYFKETRSEIVVPIIMKERLISVINLGKKSGNKKTKFTREEINLLNYLRKGIAFSIHNSELLDDIKKRNNLSLLYTESIRILNKNSNQKQALIEFLNHLIKKNIIKSGAYFQYIPNKKKYITFATCGLNDPAMQRFFTKVKVNENFTSTLDIDLIQGYRYSISESAPGLLDKAMAKENLKEIQVSTVEHGGKLYGLIVFGFETFITYKHFQEKIMLGNLISQLGSTITSFELEYEKEKKDNLSRLGQMAAGVIHDLKNPLSAIKGYAELAGDEMFNEEERKEYLSMIGDEVDRVSSMVYDILDFSKDRVKLNIIEIDPRLYLSEIQKFIFTIMKKKNIDVNYHIDDINTIHIDPEKFRRVIYNLAGNAMDAMEDGGSFSIKLKKRGRFIVFSFSDTGSGVPDEAINKLFEPFFTQGKTHGTGLGLAIVKKIVEEQGGKIEVSTKSGEGTSFHIFLPDSQGEK